MNQEKKAPRCEVTGCKIAGGVRGFCATHYAKKFLPKVTGQVPCYRVSPSIDSDPRVVWRGMVPAEEALREAHADHSKFYIDVGH